MIDVRGLSCPQPVIQVKKALEKKEASYEVLLDSMVSVENVKRFAASAGYKAKFREENGEYRMNLSKL